MRPAPVTFVEGQRHLGTEERMAGPPLGSAEAVHPLHKPRPLPLGTQLCSHWWMQRLIPDGWHSKGGLWQGPLEKLSKCAEYI